MESWRRSLQRCASEKTIFLVVVVLNNQAIALASRLWLATVSGHAIFVWKKFPFFPLFSRFQAQSYNSRGLENGLSCLVPKSSGSKIDRRACRQIMPNWNKTFSRIDEKIRNISFFACEMQVCPQRGMGFFTWIVADNRTKFTCRNKNNKKELNNDTF